MCTNAARTRSKTDLYGDNMIFFKILFRLSHTRALNGQTQEDGFRNYRIIQYIFFTVIRCGFTETRNKNVRRRLYRVVRAVNTFHSIRMEFSCSRWDVQIGRLYVDTRVQSRREERKKNSRFLSIFPRRVTTRDYYHSCRAVIRRMCLDATKICGRVFFVLMNFRCIRKKQHSLNNDAPRKVVIYTVQTFLITHLLDQKVTRAYPKNRLRNMRKRLFVCPLVGHVINPHCEKCKFIESMLQSRVADEFSTKKRDWLRYTTLERPRLAPSTLLENGIITNAVKNGLRECVYIHACIRSHSKHAKKSNSTLSLAYKQYRILHDITYKLRCGFIGTYAYRKFE